MKCLLFFLPLQADMHGLLTFVLIPSSQSKPLPVKENVVSPDSTQDLRRV